MARSWRHSLTFIVTMPNDLPLIVTWVIGAQSNSWHCSDFLPQETRCHLADPLIQSHIVKILNSDNLVRIYDILLEETSVGMPQYR